MHPKASGSMRRQARAHGDQLENKNPQNKFPGKHLCKYGAVYFMLRRGRQGECRYAAAEIQRPRSQTSISHSSHSVLLHAVPQFFIADHTACSHAIAPSATIMGNRSYSRRRKLLRSICYCRSQCRYNYLSTNLHAVPNASATGSMRAGRVEAFIR